MGAVLKDIPFGDSIPTFSTNDDTVLFDLGDGVTINFTFQSTVAENVNDTIRENSTKADFLTYDAITADSAIGAGKVVSATLAKYAESVTSVPRAEIAEEAASASLILSVNFVSKADEAPAAANVCEALFVNSVSSVPMAHTATCAAVAISACEATDAAVALDVESTASATHALEVDNASNARGFTRDVDFINGFRFNEYIGALQKDVMTLKTDGTITYSGWSTISGGIATEHQM